jgi:hypothetical protein
VTGRCCHRSAALCLPSHSLTVAEGVRVQRLEQVVLDEGSPETVVITAMELLEHGASDAALRTGTSPATILQPRPSHRLRVQGVALPCERLCDGSLCSHLMWGLVHRAIRGAGGGGAHVCFTTTAATRGGQIVSRAFARSRSRVAVSPAHPLGCRCSVSCRAGCMRRRSSGAVCVALYQCVPSSRPSPTSQRCERF